MGRPAGPVRSIAANREKYKPAARAPIRSA